MVVAVLSLLWGGLISCLETKLNRNDGGSCVEGRRRRRTVCGADNVGLPQVNRFIVEVTSVDIEKHIQHQKQDKHAESIEAVVVVGNNFP